MDKRRSEKPKCFYVTPIGKEGSVIRRKTDELFEKAINPALSDRYEIIVPHKINKAGNINQDILSHLREDELIIVNLTGKNANVYFELGMRYGLNKNFILIAETKTKLPFDIAQERTFFYNPDSEGYSQLCEQLKEVERNIPDEDEKLKYESYLGYWLEILVGFPERPVALVEFLYNEEAKSYELRGHNYHKCDRSKDVTFESELIVDTTDTRFSFFYITHPTLEDTTGIGKITFLRAKEGSFVRAEGSFFDIFSWTDASSVRKAKMIKCDKEFFKYFGINVNRRKGIDGAEILKNEKLKEYLKKNFNIEVNI